MGRRLAVIRLHTCHTLLQIIIISDYRDHGDSEHRVMDVQNSLAKDKDHFILSVCELMIITLLIHYTNWSLYSNGNLIY